ncbi:Ig-like domain repeat protein, partial [Methanobrevibacter sp.]
INNVSDVEIENNLTFTVTNSTPVNVTVNGVEIVPVNGNYTFEAVKAGEYTIVVRSVETDDYYAGFNTTIFKVFKHDSPVNITVNYAYEIETVFNITIGNATVVNVTINGKVYPVVDGKVLINGDLPAGNYTVTATIYESDKYVGNSTTEHFSIYKHASSIVNITVPENNVLYGKNATITVNMDNVVDGTILIEVAGHNYTVDIVGKVATLDIILPAGNYTARAYYMGDDKYNGTTSALSDEFTVLDKKVPVISIDGVHDIEIENNITFTVTNSTPVNVTVNGEPVYGNNGVYTYNVTVAGTAVIVVRSVETDDYYAGYNSTTFNVFKHNSTVNIIVDEEYYVGEAFNITVVNTTAVNVTINGKEYPVVDGKVIIGENDLVAGEYIITGIVKESDYYNASSYTTGFTILKRNSNVNVTVNPIKVGDVGIITITAPDDIDGMVKINVNGTNYVVDIRNGIGNLEIKGLKEGPYPINVTYLENSKYLTSSNDTATLVVGKLTTPMSVNTTDITYGQVLTINVTLPANATGYVTIHVNDTSKVAAVIDGVATAEFINLGAGTYNVHVTYDGDDSYVSNTTDGTFTVQMVEDILLDIEVSNITYGQIEKIIVFINATGNATIKVGSETYEDKVIENGKIVLEIPDLDAATYSVEVKYNGDKNHNATTKTSEFTVEKLNSTMYVDVSDILYGQVEQITVDVNTPGEVTIKVYGGNNLIDSTVGKQLSISDLLVGEYRVEVTYDGGVNYNNISKNATFKVTSAKENSMEIVDNGNGTLTVTVGDNATGNVTVKINGTDYKAVVENGVATVDISNATPGSYNVTVTYSGDNNHAPIVANASITIPKLATQMSIEVNNSLVDETITVIVTVPENITGEVTLEIDGNTWTKKPDGNKVTFTIPGLAAGDKTVVATYAGDEVYEHNSTTANFKVSKHNAPFSIAADGVDAGETVTIRINDLPGDATGYVTVDINGVEYAVNITKTKELTIPITKSGNYTVVATYLGDDKFLTNTSKTTFEAEKVSGNVEVEISNATTGGDLIVKVTVPSDAEGTITVKVGNETKVVNATGGENTIVISNMSEGSQDVNVTYSGDSKYDSKTVTKTIYVTTSINAQDKLTRGWGSPYDFEAEFLDGQGHVLVNTEVQFEVNGKTYTAKTDEKGIARLTASKLAVGTYDVTCINPATGQKVTKQVTIIKRLLNNKDITMDFYDGTFYKVKAIGDDGKAAPAGEFVAITVNGIKYAVATDKNGIAQLKLKLNPKKYTITAEYKNTKVSNKLVVKQTLKLVKKTVKVKKGKKIVLQAKLKWSNGKAIKGKVIKFKFKGKTYKAKTNKKGIAKVTIKKKSVLKKLKKGKKYKFIAKYVSNTVKGKVKIKK